MDDIELAERIRAFNRFYTETMGSLDERHEGLAVSLVESRVLHTIEHEPDLGPSALARRLRLAPSQLSRTLGELERQGLLRRTLDPHDARARVLSLSAEGREQLHRIEQRSNDRVLALVDHLDDGDRRGLLDAMSTVRTLLECTDDR